ncbi:DUF6876 family protein [uncultured Methylobacterium sp.]|jgi:hypothetical protein|uniref:DUF6876 family protein n=1 Tax=uncultured Methylobacterium sp. TaxID=157278 RepID=UPI00262C198A|nr:DUF6876 family protein [uncultured Methylobacterium sp.]
MLNLEQFSGGDTHYRHGLVRGVTYTEGAKHVAETAGAYWFLDIIATNQIDQKFKAQPFQVWKLTVSGSKAKIVVTDGNDGEIYTQDVDFTDFPEPGITLWCIDNVILLPSEY